MRYLGIYPTEQELVTEILPSIHDDEETHYVKYERFESAMLEILLEGKYLPDSEDAILRAFKVLDKGENGQLTKSQMTEILTSNDWAFREKELENFMKVAADSNDIISYEEYVEDLCSAK